MPITDKSRYPPDWPAIARAIKAAADWRCSDCGMQCRRPGERFDTHRRTMSVHHLDYNPPNDAPHHARNAAQTRRKKRIASGQMELEV